ncbi:hypothetical protein [Caulobacter sp. NIBR1757]|uniref:hypothetical protein n=1 Tax=Caulobacter sp. NIBR1757 TaxID=3016000 RepID=UPI0022F07308|nr:hypothetical protein [Caulobacter sp. NIBR1757]WGM40594.1 hypothetical protein AMEJIAPC_03539 [Caulobacter sp. NIBR1757]
MIIRTLIVSAAMAALAMPAMAAPGAFRATEPTATTVAPVAIGGDKKSHDDDKSRVVCKRVNPTGSRTPGKKLCRTAGEWAADEQNAKENLDDITRRSLTSAPKS